METKICKSCNLTLTLDKFSKDNGNNDKLKNTCKQCCSLKNAEWCKNNKEKRTCYQKEYKIKNSEHLKEYNKKINNEFKLKHGVSRHTLWDRNNKDKRKKSLKARLKNPVEALKYKLRSSFNSIFRYKGYTKKHKSHHILGCTFEEFKTYLESKFDPWMNWDNRGLYNGEPNYGWDIDHIIPISSAVTEEDVIRLNHYSNLQPLCSKINRDIKKNNF